MNAENSESELFGKLVSEMQTDVVVKDGAITGTLHYLENGIPEAGFPEGGGYFLALHWSDPDADATSLKVGVQPSSIGMDLVECINDTDRNGVFKITPDLNQRFVMVQSNANGQTRQYFSLDGLTFEGEEIGA